MGTNSSAQGMPLSDNEILRKLQVACLFNIPDGLLRLSCRIDGAAVTLLAVFDKPFQEYQRDCIWSISAELEGHFIEPFRCPVDFRVEAPGDATIDLPHLVFARYDAEQY